MLCKPKENIEHFCFAYRKCVIFIVCVLYGLQNKQRLVPDTALTDWLLYQRQNVFTSRFEPNL
jgi:hypothetical protein